MACPLLARCGEWAFCWVVGQRETERPVLTRALGCLDAEDFRGPSTVTAYVSCLSGRIEAEHLPELQRLMEGEDR